MQSRGTKRGHFDRDLVEIENIVSGGGSWELIAGTPARPFLPIPKTDICAGGKFFPLQLVGPPMKELPTSICIELYFGPYISDSGLTCR